MISNLLKPIPRRLFSTKKPLTIGIRREDKNRWERRVALTPSHVQRLIQDTGCRVLIQPSNTRIFNNHSFLQSGAQISEDLASADVILGIKEIPTHKLLPNKTYVIFSHTHKAQPYNMESLQAFLDRKIRLVDYELMADPQTRRRVVLFGRHAGIAGMIDGMHGLGQRLLALGYNSPFIHMGQAHVYPNLECVHTKLEHVGEIIEDQGLPERFSPMVFTFTGRGNVTQGAREIFDDLPHDNISVEELPYLAKDRENARYRHRLLALQVGAEDYVERIQGGQYSREEYREHPDRYRSAFGQRIAPYTSMLVNGIYWESKYPRLLTTEELRRIQANKELKRSRMLAIADISCDVNGSLEFMSHASTIEDPFFYVDATSGKEHGDIEAPGVQINSVDNLPTELPFEASKDFADALYPYAKALALGQLEQDPVLSNAVICQGGQLTKRHSHLRNHLQTKVQTKRRKRVLLAGSGMVTQPLVDYLARHSKGTEITVASNQLQQARQLARQFPSTQAALLDLSSQSSVDSLVADHDVVVSLVPASLHPQLAETAIRHGKHMVTASYISPQMQGLDSRAREANVTVINEIGLDPGIDHVSAMKIIDEAKAKGSRVRSFISWCGGLTAPEDSGNQLGYKFSWSPRGVLTAGLNPAHYKINGALKEIPSGQLFSNKFGTVPLFPGFNMEGLANRDSMQYAGIYGLDAAEMDTMFRGTLRFRGYSEIMQCLNQLGWLNLDPNSKVDVQSGKQMLCQTLGLSEDVGNDMVAKQLANKLQTASPSLIRRLMLALSEFNMLSTDSQPISAATSLDALSMVLERSLQYQPHERDMVCLFHEFGIEHPDGSYDVQTSSLVAYGDDNNTAMARTVGVPAAIATCLLLEGKVQTRGVIRPTLKEIYEPMLGRLGQQGLVFNETVRKGKQNSLQNRMSWD